VNILKCVAAAQSKTSKRLQIQTNISKTKILERENIFYLFIILFIPSAFQKPTTS
jgi:hypothetical protein